MNTRVLQCFIKVYEKKSITSAAKEVFISPQGLSKIIKQLEAELETELFYRGTQGMEATQSGELLYARARHICYLLDDIYKEISILNGSRSVLNIVMSYSAVHTLPLSSIYAFTEKNPEIQIKISEIPDTSSVSDHFSEQVDVGILVGREMVPDCSQEVLFPGEIVLLASSDHPFSSRNEVSLNELEDETLIVKAVESGQSHPLINSCLEQGISPVIKHISENLMAVHSMCRNQNVIGVSVSFLEKVLPDSDLNVIKLKEKIPMNLYFVSRNRDTLNDIIGLFHKYMKDLKLTES